MGQFAKAIEDFTQAVKLRNDNPEPYKGRGVAHSSLGQFRDAIEDLDLCLSRKPDYEEAWVERGLAYAGTGDYQRALENLNAALKLRPDDLRASRARGTRTTTTRLRRPSNRPTSKAPTWANSSTRSEPRGLKFSWDAGDSPTSDPRTLRRQTCSRAYRCYHVRPIRPVRKPFAIALARADAPRRGALERRHRRKYLLGMRVRPDGNAK